MAGYREHFPGSRWGAPGGKIHLQQNIHPADMSI
jgi:hypothetical protein